MLDPELRIDAPLQQDRLIHMPGTPCDTEVVLWFDPHAPQPEVHVQVLRLGERERLPALLRYGFPMNVHLAALMNACVSQANAFVDCWLFAQQVGQNPSEDARRVLLHMQRAISRLLDDLSGREGLYITPLRPEWVFKVGEDDQPTSHPVMYLQHAPVQLTDIEAILTEAAGSPFGDVWLKDPVREGRFMYVARQAARRHLRDLMQAGKA